MNTKRFFLMILIASVVVGALIAIGIILLGNFGEFESKILLSVLTITVTSVLGTASGAYLDKNGRSIVSRAGIEFAVIAAVMWLILVWYGTIHDDRFVQALFAITLLAVACSLLSLLSLARLTGRYVWVRYATYAAVTALMGLILYLIFSFFEEIPTVIGRAIGVLGTIVAALTILTPIFHRLSAAPRGLDAIDAEIRHLRQRLELLEKERATAADLD